MKAIANLLLIYAIGYVPLGNAAVVTWTATGALAGYVESTSLGVFSLGDPVRISFVIESNSLPSSVSAGRATYEPMSFSLAIGGYQFGPADGAASLRVWEQDDFQFSGVSGVRVRLLLRV
jgi:hypothetical protein